MPTEHEFKYLIKTDSFQEFFKNPKNFHDIEQGYLESKESTLRIRRVTDKFENIQWFFTFKQKVNNRIIEIENQIDARDGEDLWGQCKRKLQKRRYFRTTKAGKWDIDFFHSDSRIYLALAEIELEEGAPRPSFSQFPIELTNKIVKKVDLTDERFCNKLLGNVEYAKALYELKEE